MLRGTGLIAVVLGGLAVVVSIAVFFSFASVRRRLIVLQGRAGQADILQAVSVYRYDAFEDMGGKLSFSAAFLDARGNGVVISCINGRQEARTYAKGIEQGRSPYNLSPEEEEAIRLAMKGAG